MRARGCRSLATSCAGRLNVTEGGKKLVVVEQSGVPSVELAPGEHTIVGAFAWDSLPDSLQVPPETGIVSLLLEGARVGEPRRDEAGRIFLQKSSVETEGERLEIVVHRRVTDDVPLLLTTRVVLNVSGKSRELVLGKALPPGFMPDVDHRASCRRASNPTRACACKLAPALGRSRSLRAARARSRNLRVRRRTALGATARKSGYSRPKASCA